MTGTGNYINGNYIGDRWWDPLDPVEHREEYWSAIDTNDDINLVYINHPGNGFGIVAVEPDWTAEPGQQYESRSHNKISDNIIRSNRYWGVVLTNGSRAEVAHNIIAWNGDYSVANDWTSIPDKSGGLLSLFTEDQITNNDNKLQAPIIRSNNIYGNKGNQIGVFTSAPGSDYDRCMQIYNSPVIMSNNIGVEEGMPPVDPVEEYDFLICAGPTPDRTNTPDPQTPVTTLTPTPATPTPEPCNSDYPYYGSGPIFAWNNYHDPTDGHQRRMYHPMQKQRWPAPVQSFTPTPPPTHTPSMPTSTRPPTHTPQMGPSPTPFTPSENPPITPGPDYYQMGAPNWEIHGMREDPRFVGWIPPTPGYPPEFDWHLRDHSSTPERPASNCFSRGGINLNPGTTRSDGQWDSGFVDMGRHIRELVPPAENLVIDMNIHHDLPDYYYLFWDTPTYYPDGTLFHFHDIGGYIVHFGEQESTGNPISDRINPVGRPQYVIASTTEYSFFDFEIPRDATHVGVIVYTVRGAHAEIQWISIPQD